MLFVITIFCFKGVRYNRDFFNCLNNPKKYSIQKYSCSVVNVECNKFQLISFVIRKIASILYLNPCVHYSLCNPNPPIESVTSFMKDP